MSSAPATQLIAIRHGETEWNSEGRFQGQLNSVLSAEGLAQAEALGERLERERFDVLVSSDLGRTLQTASVIAMRSGHEIVIEPGLREQNIGIYQGLTPAEAVTRHPGEYARFKSYDPDFAVPDGETTRQFYQRSVECFNRLAERYRGQTLTAITHGGVLAMLYRHAQAMSLEAPRDFSLHNASVNRFRHDGGKWELKVWGDIDHLEASGADDVT